MEHLNLKEQHDLGWVKFYENLANALVPFKNNQAELITVLRNIGQEVPAMINLYDKVGQDQYVMMEEICPFTVIGTFNREIKFENKKIIATGLSNFLKIQEPVPTSFEGMPILDVRGSWFYDYKFKRQPDDINALWKCFIDAINYAENPKDFASQKSFKKSYDRAIKCRQTKWNLTMGLFWIRPQFYISLDSMSRTYISESEIQIKFKSAAKICSAEEYLDVKEKTELAFRQKMIPERSFIQLVMGAENYGAKQNKKDTKHKSKSSQNEIPLNPKIASTYKFHNEKSNKIEVFNVFKNYTIKDIESDGCFVNLTELNQMHECLLEKKNLILQGPPGTGKTWLAKRLAYALIGKSDPRHVRMIQFHPSISYQDFVRGYRPSKDGSLKMVKGPFLKSIEIAAADRSMKYVVVIEEINRGNPAQIFGEMLTLLEADKRNPDDAIELSNNETEEIQDSNSGRVYIPDNLFVIGTMNLADRSIALMDLAMRRRFAFFDLQPELEKWQDWFQNHFGHGDIAKDIKEKIQSLNKKIADDKQLGRHFRIGHSYFVPREEISKDEPESIRIWLKRVIKNEIRPLLEEYWFDDYSKSQSEVKKLLLGIDSNV